MKFILYHPTHFEKWNWNNLESGIGGSETHQIEMSWRLARRGHEVISYAPLPEGSPHEWRGTTWRDLEQVDWTEDGIWVIYRSPQSVDNIDKKPTQQIWILEQDEEYIGQWTPERLKKIDRIIPLTHPHARYQLQRYPELKEKIWISNNGVRVDEIRQVEASFKGVRNPKRLIYASSPDRGLLNLLKIFKRAREYDEELELHCFYGFNNIEKLIKHNPKFKHFQKTKDDIELLSKQPGVTLHGRVSQARLYEEYLLSGVWCYPTNFFETSCITSMEAQSLGAVPITNPWGALEQNVLFGSFIEGDVNDKLNQARYVGEIIRWTSNPKLQADIRDAMMKRARFQFNWERVVDQWEASLFGYEDHFFAAQYNFQLKHMKGKTLNIGCDIDMANFKKRGQVVNLDILTQSPISKVPTKADIIADARSLPPDLYGIFDTVILGDILEHMKDEDAVKSLKQAKKCLENGGYVVVTVPNDTRSFAEQHSGHVAAYHEDECSYHTGVAFQRLHKWVKDADMEIKHMETLDYSFAEGFGVLCQ